MTGFRLPEQVDFENLMTVRTAGEQRIEESEAVVFDLGALRSAGSAAVALLIAWFRYAHARGKVVSFVHLPVSVMNIIEVTELDRVLPIEEAP